MCGGIGIIVVVVKRIINIICIIVPIILIFSLFKQFIDLMRNPDNKKGTKGLFNSAVAAMVIFFIPTIVSALLSIIGDSTTNNSVYEISSCWNSNQSISSNSTYIPNNKKNKSSLINDPSEYEKGKKKSNNSNGNSNNSSSNNTSSDSSVETSYGVFLGLDHSDGLSKLYNYKLVVIDLQEFSKNDVDKLHAKGIKVYSYLNVGSVEEYRSYYKKFKNLYLGVYENWEDERWVDVSNKSFQSFIINELEPLLRSKGADGYFIDNCDVYAENKRDSIYSGLKTILSNVHSHGLPMLINGGDEFVSKAISDGSYSSLFDGVNQEEVFTLINFSNKTYSNQSSGETKRYKEYLAKVKSKNLKVYLLEYGASSNKEKEIAAYCQANGFSYYNSKSYDLN